MMLGFDNPHVPIRKLTEEEIDRWVKSFPIEVMGEFGKPNDGTLRMNPETISEMGNNIFKALYQNGEIPYTIRMVVSNTVGIQSVEFYTDCQEVILDWPPKKEEKPEDNRGIQIGAIVQHFKRETLTAEEKAANRYLYQIKEIAQHTETGEKLVVYQALYPPFATYARPADMFFSKVDKDKYPDIKQEYRLEKVEFPKEG